MIIVLGEFPRTHGRVDKFFEMKLRRRTGIGLSNSVIPLIERRKVSEG